MLRYAEWQLNNDGIGGYPRDPAECIVLLLSETSGPDRLGMLHAVLDPLPGVSENKIEGLWTFCLATR